MHKKSDFYKYGLKNVTYGFLVQNIKCYMTTVSMFAAGPWSDAGGWPDDGPAQEQTLRPGTRSRELADRDLCSFISRKSFSKCVQTVIMYSHSVVELFNIKKYLIHFNMLLIHSQMYTRKSFSKCMQIVTMFLNLVFELLIKVQIHALSILLRW